MERLSYSYNYCYGRARKAISQCLTLEPNRGYATARDILRRLYGQPHKVARSLIEAVTDIPRIHANDPDRLTDLYLNMEKCLQTLEQMNYTADLDAHCTIEKIVNKSEQYRSKG